MPTVVTAMLADRATMETFADTGHLTQDGALVTFAGLVRDHDGGRPVTELEYVGHPSAAEVLQRTAEQAAERHPKVSSMRVGHRTGLLAIGDCAFLVHVSAPHRAEAFAACSELVEEVKRVLPVWKRQVFADAGEEWVNSP